jgi:hypothetical protein
VHSFERKKLVRLLIYSRSKYIMRILQLICKIELVTAYSFLYLMLPREQYAGVGCTKIILKRHIRSISASCLYMHLILAIILMEHITCMNTGFIYQKGKNIGSKHQPSIDRHAKSSKPKISTTISICRRFSTYCMTLPYFADV